MRVALKRIVQKAFETIGLEIRRRPPIETTRLRSTLVAVLDHVQRLNFNQRTVVDVGVGYGTLELYEKFPYATHLLVEPLVEFNGSLRELCKKFKCEYVSAAAGRKTGTKVIHVHRDHLEGSSTLRETEGPHIDGIPRTVRVVAIDDLCRDRNLLGPYLLKIDVQGAEIDVLEGASRVLREAELVVLEVSLFQFFVDGPQLYEIVDYMKRLGFVVYDIFGGRNRPLDDALALVDMAFVKEDGQFRKSHSYATRSQRATMGFKFIKGHHPFKETSRAATRVL